MICRIMLLALMYVGWYFKRLKRPSPILSAIIFSYLLFYEGGRLRAREIEKFNPVFEREFTANENGIFLSCMYHKIVTIAVLIRAYFDLL